MKSSTNLGKRHFESDDEDFSLTDAKSPSIKPRNSIKKLKKDKKSKSPSEVSAKKRAFPLTDDTEKANVSDFILSPVGTDTAATPKTKRPRVSEVATPDSKDKAKDSSVGSEPSAGSQVVLLATIRKRFEELNQRTLYIRKLPRKTNLGVLKSLCRTSINARLQNTIHSKKRHAFVEYKSAELAKQACESLNGKLISDVPIKVEVCSERTEAKQNQDSNQKGSWRPPSARQLSEFQLDVLHVSCISRQTTEQELRDLFPTAKSIQFFTDPKSTTIHKCNVAFANEADALLAFTTQHGVLLHDSPISVNFAFKKVLKQSQRHQEHQQRKQQQQEKPTLPIVVPSKPVDQKQTAPANKSKKQKKAAKENSQSQPTLAQPVGDKKEKNEKKKKMIKKNKANKNGPEEFEIKTSGKKISALPSKPIVKKRKLV